jgi:hypothetical protein
MCTLLLASFGSRDFLKFFLAQMKKIHCEEKEEQQTPKMRGTPLHIWNLN